MPAHTKMTKETVESLVHSRKIGLKLKHCAYIAHIDPETLRRWLRDDEEFRLKFRAAEAEAVREALLKLQESNDKKIVKDILARHEALFKEEEEAERVEEVEKEELLVRFLGVEDDN